MSIRTETHGHVLVITIDRPEKRNALSMEMGKNLAATWTSFRDDPKLWVAVITGAGDRSFCAGADLSEVGKWYGSMTPIERRERGEREPGVGGLTRNLDPGKPVIAAVNGHCLAGGLEIALACDIRIAAEHATFGLPEVKRGIIPGAGGTQRLARVIPFGMALEMLYTGDAIDAATALRVGLVNKVVARDELMESALQLAERITQCAPLAVQAARYAAKRGIHLPLDEGLRLEQFYAEPLRSTQDAKEGVSAFIEKRKATFKGR